MHFIFLRIACIFNLVNLVSVYVKNLVFKEKHSLEVEVIVEV